MSGNDTKYLVALNHFLKFGPIRLKRLNKYFDSFEAAFKAGQKALMAAGIEEAVAGEFLAMRNQLDPDGIMEALGREEIGFIRIDDENYPRLLKEIYAPPPLLYYKGRLSKNDELSLAVVGTRKFTSYGKRVCEEICYDLAKSGICITSGLALGIDSFAHLSTLEAGGRTVAVLATGLDKQSVYPKSNRYIAERIVGSGGMLVSEFPLATPPLKHHFPQRNRIISGLSLGTLVIEAAEKSGALITAYHALEQNREVFAVPGPIYSDKSAGTHALLKRGSQLATSAGDILDILDLKDAIAYIDTKRVLPETDEERTVAEVLNKEPKHINDIVAETKLDTSTINSTLIIMEMKGIIKNVGKQEYVLVR